MTYNIHPIFVHFPIALLVVYSVIKIIPFERWLPQIAWRHIERVLLFLGVIGAFVANITGETAEHIAKADRALVNMHSSFATWTIFLYGLLLFGEIVRLINLKIIKPDSNTSLVKILLSIERILLHSVLSRVIAFAALITITITGLLGGVIVYGTSADPFAPFILNLLNINY